MSILRILILSVFTGVFSSTVGAVEPREYSFSEVGAIAPHVRLEFASDNNPLRSESGSEDAFYLRARPEVEYIARVRNNRLSFGYTGNYYQYLEDYCNDSTTDQTGDCPRGSPSFNKASYQDHTLSVNGFLAITKRLRASGAVIGSIEHQPLGTGLSNNEGVLNDLTEPESRNRLTARGQLAYGTRQARGEFRAGLAVVNSNFDSERGDFDNLDEDSILGDVTLLYRVGSRTQLFGRLGNISVTGGDSERNITLGGAGVEFDSSSSVTSGSIELRYVLENFDDELRSDVDFIGWDVELTWRPRTFSTITLGGTRETTRDAFNEGLALNSGLDVRWTHFWRDRFSTIATAGFSFNEDLDDERQIFEAEDDTFSVGFEANYNVRRWFDVGGFLEFESRDGVDIRNGVEDSRDYDRTVLGVTVNGTI